jgi:hypothetical protein
LILMAVDHQRTRRRILKHLHKKGRREPLIIDQSIIVKEGACQVGAEAAAEAHSSLHISCITTAIQTIKQNIAQFA